MALTYTINFLMVLFFFFLDFIDLSDESGSLKNLQSHPLDYGTKYLNEREILILVKGESKLLFCCFGPLEQNLFQSR